MDETPSQGQISRAVRRAERGVSLDRGEVLALLHATGDELDRLVAVAGAVRDAGLADAGRPGTITYSPKVFIPLTRLCRDRCSYCTFATDPASLRRAGQGPYLTPDEVFEIVERGREAGCREALLTLGDRPESRWAAATTWLDEQGFDSTLDYVRATAIDILERTGLLPHVNAGVMTWQELQRMRPVSPSMGMMLETTSRDLFERRGGAHHGSPDKDPDIRLRVIEDAGRLNIPFTTGLLVGIGESGQDRVDGLFALRSLAREYGHIQEVLIQNFLAKPGTAAALWPSLPAREYLAMIATARVVLGPGVRLQVPPNLSEPDSLAALLRAGVDDLGGISPVTPDHVNPERPWPEISTLARICEAQDLDLRPRLTVHPEYVSDGSRWIDPQVRGHVQALADSSGLAGPATPIGRPWQQADPSYGRFARDSAGGRTDLATSIDLTGRLSETRSDMDSVYGDWDSVADRVPDSRLRATTDRELVAALDLAARDPAALRSERHADAAVALMRAEGAELELLCEIADQVRQQRVGQDVTYVVNRNINFTNVCYTGCRFCAFAQRESDVDAFTLSREELTERVREAVSAGATEICMQGGIHPDLPGTAYFDLIETVKVAAPEIHLHAFSPMEVVNGASKAGMTIRDWLARAKDAGLDTIPGTAAEILDDEVRWILTKGKLPTSAWVEVVQTAHELGIRSSSTMMYGHVDRPDHWVAHLRLLAQIQGRTGGFTEFVPLPFVHQQAPIYLAGVARPGPSVRDNRAVHAMARLMLDGLIDNIQCSWVKLGPQGCAVMLAGGANDLGGTLMEETISRMAGSGHGSAKEVEELRAIAALAGRPARQRSTSYGHVQMSDLFLNR